MFSFQKLKGDFFYHLTHQMTLFLPRLASVQVFEGRENVPATGGALLLSNHISHFDPSFMGVGFPRQIHFMADKPLTEIPIFGWMLRQGHVFAIDRTKNDIGALKMALTRLKQGNVVAIFPEEGIRQAANSVLGGAEMPAGTASLWKKTGVPVIPMVIIGTDQMYALRDYLRWPRKRIFIRVGKPLLPDPSATREELRDRVSASWRELYTGLIHDYDIQPDELPKTAQERWGKEPPPFRKAGEA